MFPPMGGGGVQRIKHLSEFLSRSGFEVTVFTEKVDRYKYDVYDNTNKCDPSIKVLCPEGNRYFKRKSSSNENQKQPNIIQHLLKKCVKYLVELLMPDTLFMWVYRSYKFSKKLHENSYDYIISSVRPPSNAIVGHMFSKSIGAKHIVEFRDLWFGQEFQTKNMFRNGIQKMYQNVVLKNVQDIPCVSSAYIDVLKKDYPDKHYHLIMNGYNSLPLRYVTTNSIASTTGVLRFGHFGRFYGPRSIDPLVTASIELGINVEVFHYGPEINNSEYSASSIIKNKGYVSFSESLEIQSKGEFDVLLIMEATSDNIPGKAFEYVLSPKPTVVICPSNSVIRKEFLGVAGWYFIDADRVLEELPSLQKKLLDQEEEHRYTEKFSRDYQAKKYLNLLS